MLASKLSVLLSSANFWPLESTHLAAHAMRDAVFLLNRLENSRSIVASSSRFKAASQPSLTVIVAARK